MKEITLKELFKRKSMRMVFLILCSLLISGNALSRKGWNDDYMQVNYDANDGAVIITFLFYDYCFGQWWKHAYIDFAYIQYSFDENSFNKMIECKTSFQNYNYDQFSAITMEKKAEDAVFQFNECYFPKSGTMWNNESLTQVVTVKNIGNKARLTIKWFLKGAYLGVKFISITGRWTVRGGGHFICSDAGVQSTLLSEYIIPYPVNQAMKSMIETDTKQKQVNTPAVDLPENNEIKVSKYEDAIVINGAEPGENIKIYTTSGALVKSIIANDDVVNIKLSTNQMYIVNVAQKRHRVAL